MPAGMGILRAIIPEKTIENKDIKKHSIEAI